MFEPTIPFGEPELMRVSAFQRYLDELVAAGRQHRDERRLSSLSPSLAADLMRFEQDGRTSEALEVLAACVRHAQSVTIHLQWSDKVVPLTVFPHERLVHCPLDVPSLLDARVTDLRVLHVEPAMLRPPGDAEQVAGRRPRSALTRSGRCCGSSRCAASAPSCCPRSPAPRRTASRPASIWAGCG